MAGGAAQSVPHRLIGTAPASYVTTQQTVMGYHLNQIYLEANEGRERVKERMGKGKGESEVGYREEGGEEKGRQRHN